MFFLWSCWEGAGAGEDRLEDTKCGRRGAPTTHRGPPWSVAAPRDLVAVAPASPWLLSTGFLFLLVTFRRLLFIGKNLSPCDRNHKKEIESLKQHLHSSVNANGFCNVLLCLLTPGFRAHSQRRININVTHHNRKRPLPFLVIVSLTLLVFSFSVEMNVPFCLNKAGTVL